MMLKLSKLVFVMVAVAGIGAVAAEPKNIEELKKHFSSVSVENLSFTADYAMEMDMSAMGQAGAAGEMSMIGKMTAKGEKMRITMKMNMGEALGGMVMDMDMAMDENMVMHMRIDMQGMIQAMKMDMNVMKEIAEEMGIPASALNSGNMGMGMMGNPSKILEMYEDMYDLEFLGKETLNDEEVFVIGAAMKSDTLENLTSNPLLAAQAGMFKNQQKVYLGAKDGVMRKMDMGGFMTMTLSNFDFESEIDDSVFTLELPEGTMEMDMTQMIRGMLGSAAGAGADGE